MKCYCRRKLRHQLVPDTNGQVFSRTHFTLQKRHIQVKVLMIQQFQHMLFYNNTQFLYIKQKTGIGIGLTFDSYI